MTGARMAVNKSSGASKFGIAREAGIVEPK